MCLPGALSEVRLQFMRLHDPARMHQLQADSDALGAPRDGVLAMRLWRLIPDLCARDRAAHADCTAEQLARPTQVPASSLLPCASSSIKSSELSMRTVFFSNSWTAARLAHLLPWLLPAATEPLQPRRVPRAAQIRADGGLSRLEAPPAAASRPPPQRRGGANPPKLHGYACQPTTAGLRVQGVGVQGSGYGEECVENLGCSIFRCNGLACCGAFAPPQQPVPPHYLAAPALITFSPCPDQQDGILW